MSFACPYCKAVLNPKGLKPGRFQPKCPKCAETFVLVPAGAAHTFGNRSDAPARLLVIHAPALDGYFAELEQLWGGDEAPTPEQERALMSRHGMEPA